MCPEICEVTTQMKLDITALLESLLQEESNPGLRIRERRKPAKFREILEKIFA